MTVIVAKFNKKRTKIIIGSDSQITFGGCKETKDETSSDIGKVLLIEKDYGIACCGKVSEITIFQRYCQRTKPKGNTENDIFDFMMDFKDWATDRKKDFQFQCNYIIVFMGKMFSVLGGYLVVEHFKHISDGSGHQSAMVALNLGKSVEVAIDMAKKFDLYCGGETQIIKVKT